MGKPGACLRRAGASWRLACGHFMPHMLSSEPILLQQFLQPPAVHRFKPAYLASLHFARLASCPALLPLQPGKPPKPIPPTTHHPVGLPFTSGRSEPVNKHPPLCLQRTVSRYTLHTSSESPQQNRVPVAHHVG